MNEDSWRRQNPREKCPISYSENYSRRHEGLPALTPYVTEDDLAREKWKIFRDPVYPEPQSFKRIEYAPSDSIRQKFAEHGLQIIVKMATAELTPERPEFPGGSWHVSKQSTFDTCASDAVANNDMQIEGQMNERICATALYYVDCENVTPSRLSFRMSTDPYLSDEIRARQDEYNWLEKVHGASLGPANGVAGSCLQNYGDVETRQGRVLAFPNV